jgi:hypothetical protein
MQKSVFSEEFYEIKKYKISFLAANVFAFLYSLPFLILFAVMFITAAAIKGAMNQGVPIFQDIDYSLLTLGIFIVISFALVVLHELLHALYFLPGCENGWKSIKFGVKSLTPYCHCEEVIRVAQYRKSLFAPLWFICLPLAILASLSGNLLVIFLAVTMIVGSGGDLFIAYALRKYPGKTTSVYDLVDEIGCEVYLPRASKLSQESEIDLK